MIKAEIYCPFCLENTGRWKVVKIATKSYNVVFYDEHGHVAKTVKKTTQDAANEQEIVEFQARVLGEHLDKCPRAQYLSSSVKQHYKLT